MIRRERTLTIWQAGDDKRAVKNIIKILDAKTSKQALQEELASLRAQLGMQFAPMAAYAA